MEGVSAEASSLAGHLKLGKLIVIYDSNKITIEGSTDITFTESVKDRYAAYGWHVQEIDGHMYCRHSKSCGGSAESERQAEPYRGED